MEEENKTNEPESLAVSTKNAALLLSVSVHQLELSRVTGDLCGAKPPPYFRIGRKLVRYKVSDLRLWLSEQPTYKTLAEENTANR